MPSIQFASHEPQATDDLCGVAVEAALLAGKRNSITSAYRLAVQQMWLEGINVQAHADSDSDWEEAADHEGKE